jgi:sugar lactone lactonase YvrE
LWFAACARAVCPIVHFDLRSGAEDSRARFASPEPEVARITAGDGALFALTADYKGLPYHVSRIDPATGATEWTVPVPGTSVVGEVSRARLAFGLGSLWFSAGTQSVLRISPANGHVTGTIHVPAAVEDSGNVGIAFGANAVWLASDSPRAAVMRIDARTLGASVVQRFGAGFTQSLAATDGAVWTTHAATPAGLELTRIGTSAPYPADAFAIPTPNVAASDQSVWFQGWEPAEKAYDPANRYGIIGRVDPSSGNVVGAVELRIGPLDDVNLFVVGTDVYVLDTTARTLTEVRGGSR